VGSEVSETATDAGAAGSGRDRGYSLAEVLVAMSLLGSVVVVTLVGIQTVIMSSATDRDQALTFEWLQAASDAIHVSERVSCTADGQGRTDAIAAYDLAAQSVSVPPMWSGTTAAIEVTDVEYLGRTSVDADFEWSPDFCFEGAAFAGSPLYTQRVTIEVVTPGSATLQTLEMVKSE